MLPIVAHWEPPECRSPAVHRRGSPTYVGRNSTGWPTDVAVTVPVETHWKSTQLYGYRSPPSEVEPTNSTGSVDRQRRSGGWLQTVKGRNYPR
jgi:hypothetical protein